MSTAHEGELDAREGGGAAEGAAEGAEALAARLFEAGLAAMDLFSVHLGDQLGWYRALADGRPTTPSELAAASGTAERYAREWLEQQAVTGLVEVAGSDPGGPERRYVLPAASREVLTDRTSLLFTAPLARFLASAAGQLPALVAAYRDGGGVPWSAFGEGMRTSQADLNRPWLESRLPGALRADGQLSACLEAPGARVADVGCGAAWSSVAIARTFPGVHVDAVDVDAPTVDLARATVAGADLSDRVHVELRDAADLPAGAYDVVFAFECLHDLPHPVQVLTAARAALRPGGQVVVMDEAVAEEFTAPGDEVERLMYGYSLLVCLPDAMSTPGSAATGTVMRPEVLRAHARAAGFSQVEVLPVEDAGFWRFYRLLP